MRLKPSILAGLLAIAFVPNAGAQVEDLILVNAGAPIPVVEVADTLIQELVMIDASGEVTNSCLKDTCSKDFTHRIVKDLAWTYSESAARTQATYEFDSQGYGGAYLLAERLTCTALPYCELDPDSSGMYYPHWWFLDTTQAGSGKAGFKVTHSPEY